MVSKPGAGTYVAEHFPRWAALAARAVAARQGAPAAFTLTDGLDAAALVDAVVADAHRRFGS